MDFVQRSKKVFSPVQGHYTEIEVRKGKGSYLYTVDGRKLLDFASGIAVSATGHAHPKVVKAICKQSKKLIHHCAGVTYAEPMIDYAEKLQKVVPVKNAQFFFNNSGSEAVEGAMKVAKYVTKRPLIIALEGGFHGRSWATMTATSSNKKYNQGYGKLVPDIKIVKRDMKSIKKIKGSRVAAILTEPIIGEAGYVANDKKFLKELATYCKKNKILMIFDEVQSGFGRTGKMFASEWYGINPDIMTLAKGIASGMPMGVIAMTKPISQKWTTSAHGGTFGGNPVVCRAAEATLDVIQKELPKMAKKIEIMDSFLSEIDSLLIAKYGQLNIKIPLTIHGSRVTGLGFMKGIHFDSAETFKIVQEKVLEKNLLLISNGSKGNVIRLAPPLTINNRDLKKGLKVILESITEVVAN